jgi:hypothetical protein
MRPTLIICSILFTILTNAFAQDIITKKIDETIIAKVLEVSKKEIKYKKFDNLDGPTFTIDITDITSIQYQNGTKDVFDRADFPFKIAEPKNMSEKAIEDAHLNYNAENSGKGWTAATTILFSPLIGIIPAIGCSSSRPKESNLNYRDSELMKNNDYNLAYRAEASKIKRQRVWRSFGISSAIWAVLYIVSPKEAK